jgi:hypothetical protein
LFQAEVTVRTIHQADRLSVGSVERQCHIDPKLIDGSVNEISRFRANCIDVFLSTLQGSLERFAGF